MRASWTGTVAVQRVTKSYPDVAQVRVLAAQPATATRLVVVEAFAQLASKLKYRRIASFTVTMQKLGPT